MTERLVAMTFEEASRWIAAQEKRIETLEAALKRACELLEMWHEEHHPMVAGCCATKQFLERYQSETPAHCEHGATNPPGNCAICSGLETPCAHRWYISNTATQTCYACGATQQGNGPIEPSAKEAP